VTDFLLQGCPRGAFTRVSICTCRFTALDTLIMSYDSTHHIHSSLPSPLHATFHVTHVPSPSTMRMTGSQACCEAHHYQDTVAPDTSHLDTIPGISRSSGMNWRVESLLPGPQVSQEQLSALACANSVQPAAFTCI
jgi:hypothetical protein